MSDKEVLAQMLNREIGNLLGNINPVFKMFSSTISNYVMSFLNPYIDAFTNPDDSHINTKAASAYLKEETSTKIEEFMKKFNEEMNSNV